MAKVSELSVIELFSKFYSQSLTAAAHIQKALVGSCLQVTVGFEKTGNPDVSQIQAIVSFMKKKDPKSELVQTGSIISWYENVAGVRISNKGKPEESIVRPNRTEGYHNREWADTMRTARSWSQHGRDIQVPKSMPDPVDNAARMLAAWEAMGGGTMEETLARVLGKAKSLIKDATFVEKIEDKKAKLDKAGLAYIKA